MDSREPHEVVVAIRAMNEAIAQPSIPARPALEKIKKALSKLKALTKKHAAVLIVILVAIAAAIFGIRYRHARKIAAGVVQSSGVVIPKGVSASHFVARVWNTLFAPATAPTPPATAPPANAAPPASKALVVYKDFAKAARANAAAVRASKAMVVYKPPRVNIQGFASKVSPGLLASTFGSFWKLIAGSFVAATVLTATVPTSEPEPPENHYTAWVRRRELRASRRLQAPEHSQAPERLEQAPEHIEHLEQAPEYLEHIEHPNASRRRNAEWTLENRRHKNQASDLEHDRMFRQALKHPNATFLSQNTVNKPNDANVRNYDSRRRAETSKLWNTEWTLENRRHKNRASDLEHDRMFRQALKHPNATFLSQNTASKPKDANVRNYDSRRRAETSKLWNTEWTLENKRRRKKNQDTAARIRQEMERRVTTPTHVPHPNTPQYQTFLNTSTANYYRRHPELIPKTTINHLTNPNSPESLEHFELLRRIHAIAVPNAARSRHAAALNRLERGKAMFAT